MSPAIDDLRKQAAELATARNDTVLAAAEMAAAADRAAAKARSAARLADAATHTAATGEAAVSRQDSRTRLGTLTDLDARLAALVAQLPNDPCDLEADVPLALMPVRLETRYADGGATLRVRIFPDDVHVDRLDRGLSDDERAAGLAYWTAVWSGSLTEDAAWQNLTTAVHPNRAPWVAAALTPDLTLRPDPPGPLPVPVPVAPPPEPRLQRPAVARALPDRFVVTAVQEGGTSRAVGDPVPAELVVGLAPGADPAQLIQHGNVVLSPEMTWLVDPVEAKRVGMLVDIKLAQPGAKVTQVFAVGIRASLDPAGGAAELSRLLDAHRYASGAAFLPPGTPTNNTETDRTSWTRHPDPTPPPTRLVPPQDPGANARLTATALGVDPALLTALPHANGTDQALAAAANTTLWQATWGAFIDRLLVISAKGPNVDDVTREAWRDYWQDNVRGRGPLPMLQLGDQPYGILPVAAVHRRWKSDGSSRFEGALLNLLRNLRRVIASGLPNVPAVENAGALDDTLL
ncbi:MAG: hypothetical protein M3011_01405, partial [Actinomycetota bacterium]|nr:hypothetical protein [Actinomycetota bacterium]